MGSAVLFVLRYIVLLYSAWSGVNRVQVILSGKKLYVWLYAFLGCTRACVCRCDGICVGHDLNQCSVWSIVLVKGRHLV